MKSTISGYGIVSGYGIGPWIPGGKLGVPLGALDVKKTKICHRSAVLDFNRALKSFNVLYSIPEPPF